MIFSSLKNSAAGFLIATGIVSGFLQAEDLPLPVPGEVEGFYPTYMDTGGGMLLGLSNPDVYRSNGSPLQPPDLDRWASTGGIWPYEIETGPVSEMHRATNWLDYIFRPLTPGETTVIQGPTSESWFQLGASFPFLSRNAHAEQTHFARIFGDEATQYSPFYFDVLAINAYAIYDDINGPGAANVDDGFASALSIDVRGIFRITHNTSLTIHGEVFFVFTDDADVGYYIEAGTPGAFVNFNLQEEVGAWDVRIFDDFYPISSRSVFMSDTYRGVVDVTGHQYLGIPHRVDGGAWWDTEGTYIVNTAGLTAGRFLGESLRLLAGFARTDRWNWDDFGDHRPEEYFGVGIYYDAYDWWIAPSLTYTLRTTDFNDPQNFLALNATAPITSNISANAGVGYSFGDIDNAAYWHIGVTYLQTERLTHTFTYSSGYQDTDIGDDYFGDSLAYGCSYRMGPRTQFGLTSAWQNDANSGATGYNAGLSMTTALANYTYMRLFAGYFNYNWDSRFTDSDGTTWMYGATLGTQLLTRLNGEISAEYVKHDTSPGTSKSDYNEFLLMLRLTRTF